MAGRGFVVAVLDVDKNSSRRATTALSSSIFVSRRRVSEDQRVPRRRWRPASSADARRPAVELGGELLALRRRGRQLPASPSASQASARSGRAAVDSAKRG